MRRRGAPTPSLEIVSQGATGCFAYGRNHATRPSSFPRDIDPLEISTTTRRHGRASGWNPTIFGYKIGEAGRNIADPYNSADYIYLISLGDLVAGAGFEPAAFRL
jgi:hypothetical protein